jgi:hypothetical protein
VGDRIDKLLDGVLVDAYGEDEQLWSFRQAFEDKARLPFAGQVVGVEVEVLDVDYDGDERRGLVAHCRRAGGEHTVSLLDVSPVGPVSSTSRDLLDAYRRWANAAPLPVTATMSAAPWMYPRFAPPDEDPGPPLALVAMGEWNPDEEYWGEPGDPLPALWQDVIAAGARPCFEMEQVIPGVDADDWDSDPIVDAAELHRAGYHREAVRILDGLLTEDRRCVDAWAHRGLVAFDTRGPGPARAFYETGVAVAERSLPVGFAGVLHAGSSTTGRSCGACTVSGCAPGNNVVGMTRWLFTALVWLDPTGSMAALTCLESVRDRQRWTRS